MDIRKDKRIKGYPKGYKKDIKYPKRIQKGYKISEKDTKRIKISERIKKDIRKGYKKTHEENSQKGYLASGVTLTFFQ